MDDTLFNKGLTWEISRIQMIAQAERKSWIIAVISTTLMVVSWITMLCLFPLKKTVPYVLKVDTTTGAMEWLTTLYDKKITYDEVMDKYWLSQYVRSRETYDWHTLQRDYDMVGLLSSETVGKNYAALFTGKEALDKQFGQHIVATIHIVSIVPQGKGVATVRFVKHIQRTHPSSPEETHPWVATIGYEYRNPSKMKEKMRLINPFGFQVVSYRVDPELGGEDKK